MRNLARRAAAALLVAPWTAAVTLSAVALAKATGDARWVPRAERLWAAGLLGAWGVHVEVENAGELDPSEACIVMCNHASHVDVPVLFAALPLVPGFLAKKELSRVPFLSMALSAGGHVLIDRSDRTSAMAALKQAAVEVRSGKAIALFPEGARGDGRVLGAFKRGGFVLARQARVPIVPVGIRGTHAVLSRDEYLPRPGTVTVHIGRAVSATEARSLSADVLLARVRREIARLSDLPEAD